MWKLDSSSDIQKEIEEFQKDLIVWKPALVGAITVIPMRFRRT